MTGKRGNNIYFRAAVSLAKTKKKQKTISAAQKARN